MGRSLSRSASPAVRIYVGLLSGLAVLPATLQEVSFEEVFTFAPILSALVLEPLQRGGDDRRGRRNYDVAVAVNIVGIIVVLLVAYGLYRLVATVIDRACATRRRVDADDNDRDSWVDAVKWTVVKRTFKSAVKRVVATVWERKVVQGATTGEPDAPVDHASVSDAKGLQARPARQLRRPRHSARHRDAARRPRVRRRRRRRGLRSRRQPPPPRRGRIYR